MLPSYANLAFMRGLIRVTVALVLLAVHQLTVQAQDSDTAFRNGLSAFQTGSYDRARTVWGALAEAGDTRAQAGLGYMYYTGRGVSRDSARAAELFQRAADKGEPTAQAFLAVMHFQADGLPRNLPLALMWLELAAAGGQPETFDLRGAIMQSMTEAEREESSRLLAQWRATHATNGARP
jgi:TPR repeat protein